MFASLDWPAFIVAMLAVELTPGPNMGWLATLSARAGRKHGLKAVAGITLGLSDEAQRHVAAPGTIFDPKHTPSVQQSHWKNQISA